MEIRPTIVDRDIITEANVPETGYRSTAVGFVAFRKFARMPDISGYVTTRPNRFSPYTLDIMVSSEDATNPGFVDRYGRDLRKEVSAVVEPWLAITAEEGDIVNFGTYLNVGETAHPSRSRHPLRRAIAEFTKFARENGRGIAIDFNYYVEEKPFVPLEQIPPDRFNVTDKGSMNTIEVISTNRPMAHATIAMQRRVSQLPEVTGLVISRGIGMNFVDVVVNADTNPQEIRVTESSVIDTVTTLEEYLKNSSDSSRVKYGGLIELASKATPDDFKKAYLDFAAQNRRREVAAALYFPQ